MIAVRSQTCAALTAKIEPDAMLPASVRGCMRTSMTLSLIAAL